MPLRRPKLEKEFGVASSARVHQGVRQQHQDAGRPKSASSLPIAVLASADPGFAQNAAFTVSRIYLKAVYSNFFYIYKLPPSTLVGFDFTTHSSNLLRWQAVPLDHAARAKAKVTFSPTFVHQ
jgi:hypothetical protein